ncbi:DUF3986 family protein [Macrococcus sp. EM39E]|uniref:DUF3986 family protein n=1 Tax=Macrococcus animalis TaxID=3395467 RepID=UPI0039BFE572
MKKFKDLSEDDFNNPALLSHFHVGYYDGGYDIEATVYQRGSNWVFYIDEAQGIGDTILREYEYIENVGYEIIKVEEDEFEYKDAAEFLYIWLIKKKLIT